MFLLIDERKVISMKKRREGKKQGIRNLCTRLVQSSYAFFWLMQGKAVVFASGGGTQKVTKGLGNLKNLFLAVVAAYGAIQVAHWVSEFGDAFSQKDGQQMRRAGRGIAGGLVEVGISAILAYVTS